MASAELWWVRSIEQFNNRETALSIINTHELSSVPGKSKSISSQLLQADETLTYSIPPVVLHETEHDVVLRYTCSEMRHR